MMVKVQALLRPYNAEWTSSAGHRVHIPKVRGSNPLSAIQPCRLGVRTPPCHGGDAGSIPVRAVGVVSAIFTLIFLTRQDIASLKAKHAVANTSMAATTLVHERLEDQNL